MRLIEITRNIRREKSRIDKLFLSYNVNKDYKLFDELTAAINDIFPTGYNNLDKTLLEYRCALQEDVINALIGNKN